MRLKFTKMHGLGNDFVVINAIRQKFVMTPTLARFLADRHLGVGCDQILLIEATKHPEALFRFRIFNADGSEVEQCGNGARCFARFVYDQGLTTAKDIPVETAGGLITLHLEDNGQVRVNMGVPIFEPKLIPFVANKAATTYPLDVDGKVYPVTALSMGNPHAVLVVPDVDLAPVATLGQLIEVHSRFPQRVNVGFMQVVSKNHCRLRVFERGVGETLACGTGACAAVVAGRLQGSLAERVRVTLPGGDLYVQWSGEGDPVWMTGPVATIFKGELLSFPW